MELTKEQADIVESSSTSIAINAFAGTGKTATLQAFAEARPNKRILYVAFNRSVAEEAQRRMPAHVCVKTSHALAFAAIARGWRREKLQSKFNAWVLLQHVPQLNGGEQAVARADALVRFLNGFCQSDSPSLREHATKLDKQLLQWLRRLGIAHDEFLSLAETVWSRMSDGQDPFPATHDTYFKLWQMNRPRLPFDVILLDEGQDTNPALFDVFVRQEHAVRVLVGDRHQNIYSFRGAMNAMEAFNGTGVERYALTHSFRFGQKIADVANIILHEFKNETRRLIGSSADEGKVVKSHDSRMKTGMLFRTNAGLFDAAASICRDNERIHFLGGFRSYAFSDILDTYYLANRQKSNIKNPFLRGFRNFDELRDYAEQTDDREIKVRCKVVEKYWHDLPEIYRRIEAAASDDDELITMATAHKAKGCEWDQVVLGDDFTPLCRDGKPNTPRHQTESESAEFMTTEEANLWYVAITRARKRLKINLELAELISWHNEQGQQHG